jgi:hypothetical protein
MITVKFTIEDFINKSNLVHKNKYNYSLVEYLNIFIPVKIICPIHGKFNQIPNSHLSGSGCVQCFNEFKRGKSQLLTLECFTNRANSIHKNKYDYSLVNYKNSKSKVIIKCKEHGEFLQTPEKHLSGQGCKKCGRKVVETSKLLSFEEFLKRANEIHKNKYDYSLIEYKNTTTKIKILCPLHGVWEQKPSKHLQGQGCRKCSGSDKLTTEIFINKASNIHDNKYDYSLVKYTNHYGKVKIICPVHNIFEQGAGSHLSGIGCPNCIESKGEKEIFNYLTSKSILFETQKTFDGCKLKNKLRFDFFLPEKNICIEYDGEQHFISVGKWGGIENLELIKKRDEIKSKFCQENNIQLIRINYKESIKDILNLNL